MTNKNISLLDEINNCDFTVGELVEGVKDWLCGAEYEKPNTPIKLEQFVMELMRCIEDNNYCREMWESTHDFDDE